MKTPERKQIKETSEIYSSLLEGTFADLKATFEMWEEEGWLGIEYDTTKEYFDDIEWAYFKYRYREETDKELEARLAKEARAKAKEARDKEKAKERRRREWERLNKEFAPKSQTQAHKGD